MRGLADLSLCFSAGSVPDPVWFKLRIFGSLQAKNRRLVGGVAFHMGVTSQGRGFQERLTDAWNSAATARTRERSSWLLRSHISSPIIITTIAPAVVKKSIESSWRNPEPNGCTKELTAARWFSLLCMQTPLNLTTVHWGRCCCSPRFDPWVMKIPWRRKWLPTPVFLPGEFHGQRHLVGYSPWGHKQLVMTEQLTLLFFCLYLLNWDLSNAPVKDEINQVQDYFL